MVAMDYWKLFLETGAPEYYMMYSQALKGERSHIPDDTSAGIAGHRLQ